jgi:hypothetical protein
MQRMSDRQHECCMLAPALACGGYARVEHTGAAASPTDGMLVSGAFRGLNMA